MNDLDLKPGDKALLQSTYGMSRRMYLQAVTVEKVTKTGLISIKGKDQRYRKSGNPTGKSAGFMDNRPRLIEWDDNLWQQFQRQRSEDAMASKLHRLSEKLSLLSRDPEKAAALWEGLPYDIRAMAEDDGGRGDG